MKKSKLQIDILEKYNLINGDRIEIKKLRKIAENEKIEIQDLILILGCYKNAKYKTDDKWTTIGKRKIYTERELVKIIKIDLKYLSKYGSRLYTREELQKICKSYDIELDIFLTYLYNYRICYYENSYILSMNRLGIWIGEYPKLSAKFIEKHYIELERKIEKIAKRMVNIYSPNIPEEDLVDIGLDCVLIHGEIERNLLFDENRAVGKLLFKAKYKMFNTVIQSFQESNLEDIIETLRYDDKLEREDKIEKWLYSIKLRKIEKLIIDSIQMNIEEILENRNSGLRRIYMDLNIESEEFYQYIENIKQKLIEEKKVRLCANGHVVIINNE